MENVTRTLIKQFSKLVKGYVERTMPLSDDTDLSVGPTTPEGYLLGDFKSFYPLNTKSRHTPL